MRIKQIIFAFLTAALLICFLIPLWTDKYIFNKVIYSSNDSILIKIPKKSSVNEIIRILNDKGFDFTPFEFKLTARFFKLDNKLRYGKFIYHPQDGKARLKDMILFLTTSGLLTVNVTIPEGSKIVDIAHILKVNLEIDSVEFVERTYDPEILEKYKIPAQSVEGYLYPETYNFNLYEQTDDVIDRLYKMNRTKMKALTAKIDSSGFNEHQILTLASIIQGEVMNYDEIYLISALYHNRLRKGMLLQADPTVQYLFDKPKRLLKTDISIDNPYNTYIYKGLPPGPINNPSILAVKAALEPADAPYIYMVAIGDGNHNFNTDLNDHINDKNRFDRHIRKENK